MKKSVFTLLLLIATNLCAQSNDLNQNIASINGQLREIKTVKESIAQRLSVRSGSIVSFDMTSTDQKGNRSSESFIIDLADIDQNAISSGIERNMMKVEIHTVNNQRLIAQVKQGEVSRYQTTFKLDVEDNDHANALINALKNAAQTAKTMEDEKFGYGSFDEIRMDLSSAVKPFSTVTVQKVTFDPQHKDKLNVHIQENNGVTKRYEFNLRDMNATTLKIEAHGTTLSVPVDAYGGEKLVKLYENELAKGFVSRFVIYAESVNQAKRIKKLFELAIEAANGKSGIKESSSSVAQATRSTPISNPSASNASQSKGGNATELTLDTDLGLYTSTTVVEFSGYSKEALRKATKALLKGPFLQDSEDQVVFANRIRIAGDAYTRFNSKIGFKDGKVRVQNSDVTYDNQAWGFSAPQKLETMDGKKLNKVVGDINNRIQQAMEFYIAGMEKYLRLTGNEDW